MGDDGMAALTSLVCQGRLKNLEQLRLSENDDITDRGVIALARAINVRGLPMLERFSCKCFDKVTIQGIHCDRSDRGEALPCEQESLRRNG